MINKKLRSIRVSDWRRRFKKSAVDLLGGRCRKCGYAKCIDALEFHHRDPLQKEFALSTYKKLDDAAKELLKCDLLCANCHREVHEAERSFHKERQAEYAKEHGRASKIAVTCHSCGTGKLIWKSRFVDGRKYFCNANCRKLPTHTASSVKKSAAYPDEARMRMLIWESPATHLAREIGVSSVALKKWCKKRGINTPSRGYWAKRQSVETKTGPNAEWKE